MKILGDLGCSESSSNLAYFKQIAFCKGKSGLTSSMLCHNDPSVFMFLHGTVHVGRVYCGGGGVKNYIEISSKCLVPGPAFVLRQLFNCQLNKLENIKLPKLVYYK